MQEDFADSTLGTAKSLDITPSLQTFTDSLSPGNPLDYYSFTLGSKSSLNLSLSGFSADADVELLNSKGEVLQTSAQPGTELESLVTTLNAGSYYIKVYSGSETTTDYNLNLSAIPSQDVTSLQNRDTLTGFSNPSFDTGVFTVGSSGQVSLDYLFDGGGYQGELAIFSLEGMEQYQTDLNEFIAEAARRALSNSDFGYVMISDATEGAKFSGILGTSDIENYNAGTYTGLKTVSMLPGDTFGVMLVPNGTVQQILDNPYADGAFRPLFSLSTANPDDAFHLGQIADVVGDGTTFVMEDLRVDTGSDKDYNDIIFRFSGATGYAELLKDVIAPGNDWRYSQLGQQVLSYVSDYDNPDKKDPGNPTYPGLPIANIPIPTVPSTTVDQGGNGISDLTGTSNGTVQPNQGGALPNTPTQIEASVTGDVIDQVSSTDPTDIYKVSSSQLSNTEISVLSGNTAVSILSTEGTLLSQQVLSRGDNSLTLPKDLPADVLLKFDNQAGADGTYILKGFESKAAEPFNIDIEFGEGLTASQQQIIQAAAKSIESMIAQGLPSAIVDGKIIDDINFKISAANLDGAGGTLAQTKIDFMRYGTLLPAQSITKFDATDLAQLEKSGQLFSVVQHEMLHGLGFGNLWEAKGLVDYAKTPFAQYTGKEAVTAFQELGGVGDFISLETTGKGSADLHWNKNLFQDELMTRDLGFQTGTDGKVFSPISPVTLAALADLGYEVNLKKATPNWNLFGGAAIRAEDLTAEQIEALQKLAQEMEAQPASDIPINVPAVDPSTISPEIWAHAERFDLNGEYYDWELVTIQPGDTVSQYVFDRMTHPSKLDNRSRVVRANDPAYWQFVVDRNIALGVQDPNLIYAGKQIWLPKWHENYEWEQEQERLRREEELKKKLEEEKKERERLEEIYRQKGSGGLEWWLAKPFPDFGDKAPYETSVRDVVGSQVPDDYFRFTLSRPGYVTIYLEDLLADADLYLYDSRNRLIGKAERSGVTDEKIIVNLQPGTYMVRVHSANGLATDYNLRIRFDGLPTRTQIGTGNSGSRNRGPIFSDPRIAQIYTTTLAQFEATERQKAQSQINTLEDEKKRLDQELRNKLAAMNAEQRAKVYAALDGVRNQGQSWVNSKANDIKDAIDSSANWVLGLIDGAIPSQIYSIPGLGGAIKSAQDSLKGAINGARSWLKDRVNDVQTASNNAISGFIDGLKNAYMTGAEINSAIEKLAQDLKGKIDEQVRNLNNSVDQFKGQVVNSLGFLRNVGVDTPEINLGFTKIPAIKWNFFDGVVAPLADKLASSVKDTATSVSNALKGAVDFIKPLAQGAVAEIVSKFLGDETGKLYNQINGIDQQIANIRAGVEKFISDKAQQIEGVVRKIESLLTNSEERRRVLDAFANYGYQTAEQAYDFIANKLEDVRKQIAEEKGYPPPGLDRVGLATWILERTVLKTLPPGTYPEIGAHTHMYRHYFANLDLLSGSNPNASPNSTNSYILGKPATPTENWLIYQEAAWTAYQNDKTEFLRLLSTGDKKAMSVQLSNGQTWKFNPADGTLFPQSGSNILELKTKDARYLDQIIQAINRGQTTKEALRVVNQARLNDGYQNISQNMETALRELQRLKNIPDSELATTFATVNSPNQLGLADDAAQALDDAARLKAAGRTYQFVKWGGRIMLVIQLAADGYEIYTADNREEKIAEKAGAWAGSAAGASLFASTAASVMVWLNSAPGPGTLAYGVVVGGSALVGGAAGYWAGGETGKIVYKWLFEKVEEGTQLG